MKIADHHEYCTGGFHPDDIVISGMSGRFPKCENIGELKEALFAKTDLLEQNTDRYEKGAADLPFSSCGTIGNLDKLDANFFSMTSINAHTTEPLQRKLLEVSYEAMFDAGYDPLHELAGCKIGVYSAISNEDSKQIIMNETLNTAAIVGYLRALNANRISYTFNFQGPSFTIDSACSSSLVALWAAVKDIQDGRVTGAVVNGGQLALSPVLTNFYTLGGLQSPTSTAHPFDSRANGIVRTETACAVFLQKASTARRAYATVLGIEHFSNGFVREGMYVPSPSRENALFKELLAKSVVDIKDIDYLEAHGTGTVVGDPIEINAIDSVFCKDREKPLYIGTIKGVLGHNEAGAGLSGTIKALITFESGMIPPNPYYESPNPNCEGLMEGRILINKEAMPLTSPYIPVNSFGVGGSIVQAMLKRNPIEYSNDSEFCNLPRLVLYAATSEEGIKSLFEYIKGHPELKPEFFALLNKLCFPPTLLKSYRGYMLCDKEDQVDHVQYLASPKKREVWFVMTGMGCQWPGMGLDMMKYDIFAESMKKSAAILKPLGIDLFDILKKDETHLLTHRKILPAFVTIAAIQIALTDMLKALEIEPDGIIGHSTGEMMCAYADGCCTAEQTILSAYWRGKAVESTDLIAGEMAAVGLTWEEATKRCPEGVYPACHNADDSVTISGPKELVLKFVNELQSENIFARIVNAYGYAFHSKYVLPVTNTLKPALLDIFRDPKPRTERWISTSYPEEEWDNEDSKLAGAEYFVHNLIAPVNFSNILKKIPSDAITIEIGPHFLLQSILKRSLGSEASYIGLMKRNIENNVEFFLESLGQMYNQGLNPKIEKLYPPVKFPVPRTTPQISDLIKWDYSQSWFVPKWKPMRGPYDYRFQVDSIDKYLLDHAIDGKPLFPATGYVYLAWWGLSRKLQKKLEEINVIVEDFKIHQPSLLSPTIILYTVRIFDGNGCFEILENDTLMASGRIYEEKEITFTEPPPTVNEGQEPTSSVPGEDIYNELRILGYEYGPAFRKLVEMSLDGTSGFVEWNNWITFMDSLLIFYINSTDKLGFCLPSGALSFKISPSILTECIEECREKNLPGIPVNFHADSLICRSPGIEITRLRVIPVPRNIKPDGCIFEEYKFVPYVHKYAPENKEEKLQKYMIACNKVIERIENRLNADFNSEKLDVKQEIEFDFESYTNELAPDYKLLSTLKQIADIQEENNETQVRKDIVSVFIQEMGKDVLNTSLLNEYCLRIMFDIISENSLKKISILEVNDSFVPVLPKVIEAVESKSVLKFKSKTLVCKNEETVSKDEINDNNIQLYSYDSLASMTQSKSHSVSIGAFCSGTKEEAQELIHLLASTVEQGGFVLLFHKNSVLPVENMVASLSNETINTISQNVLEKLFEAEDLLIISKISNSMGGVLYLLRVTPAIETPKIINMVGNEKWLDEIKAAIADSSETVWMIGEDCPSSGMIGMVNCLRHEPGGDKIRCVFIPEKSKKNNMPPFSFDHPFFKEIQKRDLAMNVHKDGSWGSFRHIEIEKEVEEVEVDYCYLNMKKLGDLSSFQWYESSVKYLNKSDDNLIHIYYSALNFKDVMIASGKIALPAVRELAGSENCLIGIEFSGRNSKGERVAGANVSRCIASAQYTVPCVTFAVPDEWSLEDAATVPIVYTTSYYALIIRGGLKPGESILIHSGCGGVGLASINIALSMNCEIFTTVGTEEKKQYLLKKFPSIKPENIGCSRNITFEHMIMKRTKGKGVDVVLNSLADEKFYASIRCVAKHGRFLELGKYDLLLDHSIGSKIFLDNIQFHGVVLDQMLLDISHNRRSLEEIRDLMIDGIKNEVVKPLERTVFAHTEAEKAFRYMASGTHIGKILFKIRDEEDSKLALPKILRVPAVPVTYFYPHKVYIVIGGLGGFGMEVCKWILFKGAENVILTSRYGARTPYHHLCLKKWKRDGYNVIVSTKNVSIKDEAKELLEEAAQIGPVGGIFNSAVVLHDAFLENMNMESFKDVCAPKADATEYLDTLSRCMCPELDHFVCFSSMSCGRGNAGQMNYGYANSVMERICEQRQAEGLPGLAIQWGIIGEVGVVHRHMGDDAVIFGVGAQKVYSCLKILDIACQKKKPVVCTYVLKDSRKKLNVGDPLQQIAKILGLKDISELNTVRNFGEMGVDSLAGIEIKQLLESALDTTFTMKEIQDMKVDDVKRLLAEVEAKKKDESSSVALVSTTNVKLPKSFFHSQAIQPLNSIKEGSPVFIIDIDCSDLTELTILGEAIKHPAFAVVSSKESTASNLESLASWYLEKIDEVTQNGINKRDVHIIAHSSASILAFEICLQSCNTEKNIQTFTILNGSSYLVKTASKEAGKKIKEVDIVCDFVERYIPVTRRKLREQLSNCVNLEQQTRTVVNMFMKASREPIEKAQLSDAITSSVKKMQQLEEYSPQATLATDLLIIEDSSQLLANDVAETKTQLSKICSGKINVERIPDIINFNKENVQKIISILESVF